MENERRIEGRTRKSTDCKRTTLELQDSNGKTVAEWYDRNGKSYIHVIDLQGALEILQDAPMLGDLFIRSLGPKYIRQHRETIDRYFVERPDLGPEK